jgi:hypothetical protein
MPGKLIITLKIAREKLPLIFLLAENFGIAVALLWISTIFRLLIYALGISNGITV